MNIPMVGKISCRDMFHYNFLEDNTYSETVCKINFKFAFQRDELSLSAATLNEFMEHIFLKK